MENLRKSRKNTSGQASGPCKGSRRAKMALKVVRYTFWGVPWAPLGEPKITKKSKKWSPKIDEKTEGFKRTSQSRFTPIWGGQKLQNEVKNESEMNLGNEKTDFCKGAYFIGPADAGRLSKSKKSSKIMKKNIKFHDENEYAKKSAFWDRLLVF